MDNDINMVSSSPERHTFGELSSSKKLAEDPSNEAAQAMLDWYEQLRLAETNKIVDPEWQKDNMEYDLRSTPWILEKVRSDEVYAQHLYAGMCNRDFTKNEVWPLLAEKKWSCSWRAAGGIIANMREEGDYIDWYCSGIRGNGELDDEQFREMTKIQQEHYLQTKAYVSEGYVTDEIEQDLLKLGWVVLPEDMDQTI